MRLRVAAHSLRISLPDKHAALGPRPVVKVAPADNGFQVCVTQPRHVVGEPNALKLAAHERACRVAPRKRRIAAARPCDDQGQFLSKYTRKQSSLRSTVQHTQQCSRAVAG